MKKIVFGLLCALMLGSAGCKSDMEVVRERVIEQYLNDLKTPAYEAWRLTELHQGKTPDAAQYVAEKTAALDESVAGWLENLNPDGTWNDINYQGISRSGWEPASHRDRINLMTKAYCIRQSTYYQDENLLQTIFKTMDWWHNHAPHSTNWWIREIGGPMTLGQVYLVLQEKLSPAQWEAAMKEMEKAKIKITGQNKVWLCSNVMLRALLTDDKPLFEEAVREMKNVIRMEDGEGLQRDWSFHQHGRQQQFGNYGLSYPSSLISRGRLFIGTKYAYSDHELELLRNYLLKGMSWVIWKGEMDVNALGRQLFYRNAMIGKAATYGNLLLGMSELDPAHTDTYQELFREQILKDPNTLLSGLKHFYMSDETFMRTGDWMASLKMQSDRTVGSESVNRENLLHHVMANGALYIYQDGGEYNNIFPVWDWTKVPGVTCNYASHFDFPMQDRRIKGKSGIVGGLVKDDYAVSCMRVDADGLRANKSWFFTGDYILCLGSDIASANGNAVTTAVNQTFRRGDAQAKRYGESDIQTREALSGDIEKVSHGQIGYYFAPGQRVQYTLGEQTGSWHHIHMDSKDTVVRGEVFNLWLEHGRDPKAGGYQYVVLPRRDVSGLTAFTPDYEVVKCSDDVHAVRFSDGTVRAVFFAPNTTLKVDERIEVLDIAEEIIMVFRREGNKVYVTYVDPTGEKDSTIITFKGKWKGDNALYFADRDVTVVEFDAKISWGQLLETECELLN